MTQVPASLPSSMPAAADDDAIVTPTRGAALAELTKARLSLLVLWTTATGAVVAAATTGVWPAGRILGALAGTALAAAAAAVLNQRLEVERDRAMRRTRRRPLVTGAISLRGATSLGVALAILGPAIVWAAAGWLPAALALGTIVLYIAVYTPLKTRSTLNTLVGAVVGAVPPMIGWAAVTGGLEAGAWVLAALLFVWQVPHFLALAWMYREDYARGGFVMLPAIDPRGRLTSQMTLVTTMMLVPVGLAATLLGLAGGLYAVGFTLLGVWMTRLAWRFARTRAETDARQVFLASLLVLSVGLVLMVADRTRLTEEPVVHQPVAAPTTLAVRD